MTTESKKPQLTETEKKSVMRKVTETVTEKPQIITIPIKPKGKFHAWRMRHKLAPTRHVYEIRPQRVVNIYRMAGRAVSFDVGDLIADAARDRVGTINKVMSKYGEDIFYIVACAIQNDDREPTEEMLNIVRNDFEMEDIATVMKVAVENYNVPAFINSIALMVGIEAINLNPTPKASPKE